MKIEGAERVQVKSKHFTSYQQEQIRKLKQQGKNVINLGRGNPDQETFPKIINRLKSAIDEVANQGYPPYGGKVTLKEAIIKFYDDEYGVKLTEDEVTIFSGSLAALTALPMSLVNPNDIVLTPDPAFFGYDSGIKMASASSYPLPLTKENNYLPEYDLIPNDVLEKAKLLFLNYPNNPTGAGATSDFFKRTVEFARKNNIVVAHDFAYSDISFKSKSPSFLQTDGAKEVGIEIYTLSKTFNMAGWRIAFAIGNKQIINLLKGYIKASVGGTFGAVQDAAIYALLNSQSERKELRNLYKYRRDLAYSLLKAAGFDVVDSEGTFFLWFKLHKRFSDDVSFVDSLLFEKQVALIPGSTFGKNGEGYLRLSLVSDLGYIEEGIRRLINFVNENG